jgi:flagellar biosynthesis/type III secretory pathway protein FliH
MSSEHLPHKAMQQNSRPFHYHTVLDAADSVGNGNGDAPAPWDLNDHPGNVSIEQREAAAFERGIQEGEARARQSSAQQLNHVQAAVEKAIEVFKAQREEYFVRIEPEVVQLALAIARKILHREAQMDPLLLTGIVHVALEKLDAGARVRLRAYPADVHLWNEHFAGPASSRSVPELIGDPALQPGELCLETEVGSTQISLETQVKEIEQGFFDLLEQRPRVR